MNTLRIVIPKGASTKIDFDLVELTKILVTKKGCDNPGGGLGGEYGYPVAFKNEVFEMFPYWWGDCECGFQEKVESASLKFEKKNKHAEDCFSVKYRIWEKENRHLEQFDRQWSREANKFCRENGKMDGWGGIAAYCDCGFDKRYGALIDSFGEHPEECPCAKPNFHHFKSGLKIWTYKYWGRSMEYNFKPKQFKWKEIYLECLGSIK